MTIKKEVTLDAWVKHFSKDYNGFCFDTSDINPKEELINAGFKSGEYVTITVSNKNKSTEIFGQIYNGGNNASLPICYLTNMINQNEELSKFNNDEKVTTTITPYKGEKFSI